ncbi:MAG TPA: diguanylate cyclase [Dehalococcoidia bacterium]|nr:diguanylate cyclase [Dehalococcoidia bacterium]
MTRTKPGDDEKARPARPVPDAARAHFADDVSSAMAALLPLHSAPTLDWLADAVATAAERTLDAPFAFLYLEDQDGRLDRKVPASDLRRRSQQRAIDAFGERAIPFRIDPAAAPAFAEVLEAIEPVTFPVAQALRGLATAAAADAAQQALALHSASIAPLESAGERVGALLLLTVKQPEPERVRLFADHVACATVNLRQSQSAREQGVVDISRNVFDARKIEGELQKELARAARYRRVASIAIVEATNLRLLRERFGAFLTERLLQRLGGALAQDARDIDVIGAYKQSGYTMILTEATAEGAALAARRLLRTARQAGLGDDNVPGLELHLVCGWATCPIDGDTSDLLFAAAERRMYDPSQQVA